MNLTELRRSLTDLQKVLLDKICDVYLAKNEGVSTRVLHQEFGKPLVKEALRGLGGTVVFETGERAGVSYYQPTSLGLLLNPKGNEDEKLLVRFLDFLQEVYQAKPDQSRITSDEVRCRLELTADQSIRLHRLVMSFGLWNNTSTGPSAEGAWDVGMFREVDDLPSCPSKRDFLGERAIGHYDPSVPVFHPDRLLYQSNQAMRSEVETLNLARNQSDPQRQWQKSADGRFTYEVFLSHSAKDKAVVRPLAERLRQDGLRVWFDEWVLKAGDSIPAKIEEGLEHSRVLVLCMSANAFGSDWAQLEAGTFRFRDPLNKERRFIPLRLDDTPIKGSLAQFLYINWLPKDRDQEYAKLMQSCSPPQHESAYTIAEAEPSKKLETAASALPSELGDQTTEPSARPIGDAWSGIRAVLHCYSTGDIKKILGKAGLPISKIEYRGTYKGPFLNEVDRILSGLYNDERDRGVTNCIQEIIAFERNENHRRLVCGAEPNDNALGELRRVLGRFGHELKKFEVQ